MPSASCLQTSSPAMYVACTYRASFSRRKSAWARQKGGSCQRNGAAEAGWEELLPTTGVMAGWQHRSICAVAVMWGLSEGCTNHHQHPRQKHWSKSTEQIPGRASLPAAPTEVGHEDAFTAAPALLQHPGVLTPPPPYQYLLSPHQYLHRRRNLMSPFCVQSPGAGQDAETLPPVRSLQSTLGQRSRETLGQQTAPNPLAKATVSPAGTQVGTPSPQPAGAGEENHPSETAGRGELNTEGARKSSTSVRKEQESSPLLHAMDYKESSPPKGAPLRPAPLIPALLIMSQARGTVRGWSGRSRQERDLFLR